MRDRAGGDDVEGAGGHRFSSVKVAAVAVRIARREPDRTERPRVGDRRAAADLAHRALRPHEVHLTDRVTGPLRTDRSLDLPRQVVVAAPVAHDRPQVELAGLEETRAELTLGGDAHPVAVAAEG